METPNQEKTEPEQFVIEDKKETEITSFRRLFKENWQATTSYCLVFGGFGLCVSFLGPTILDLGCQTETGMDVMGWVFVSQSVCTLIGSALAGYLERRCSANNMVAFASVVMPVCLFIIPFTRDVGVLIVVLATMGMNMGLVDCLANLQMIKLYGVSVPPFLQTLHFSYGIGAFVAPLIAEPFIVDIDCTPYLEPLPNVSNNPEAYDPSVPLNMTLAEIQDMSNVRFAFWIFAAVQIPIPIFISTLIYKESRETDEEESFEKQKKSKVHTNQTHAHGAPLLDGIVNIAPRTILVVTALSSAMVFIYDGLQAEYADYIYSYAVEGKVQLQKLEAAYLNAIFWGVFALGRLISIPISTRLSPALMLCFNVGGCLVSLIFMMALRTNHAILFSGTAFLGLFLSSVTPTVLSLTEIFIDATNSITTAIVVTAALGEMVFPAIESKLFVAVGPFSFLEFATASVVLSVAVLLVLLYCGCHSPKYRATKQSFIHSRTFLMKTQQIDVESSPIRRHVKYYTKMTEAESTITGDVNSTNELNHGIAGNNKHL